MYEGEFETDNKGQITKRKYSPLSRAQRFGEKVFNTLDIYKKNIIKVNSNQIKEAKIDLKKQIEAIKSLIMNVMEKNNDKE